jgi:two-component system CheB/CheR fusion protein
MNEELSSSNEELETSREELQSLNEELITRNRQLEERLRNEKQTSDDLHNLLSSTQMAVVILDLEGRVQRFTGMASSMFNLIHTDVGTPIFDHPGKLNDQDLEEHVSKVLDDRLPQNKILESGGGQWYQRRILPYYTADKCMEGVVLTYADVTELTETQLKLKESEDFWKRLFIDVPFYMSVWEGPEHRCIFENNYHREHTGSRNLKGKTIQQGFPELVGSDVIERFDQAFSTGKPLQTKEFTVALEVNGKPENRSYKQVVQPWFKADGSVGGIVSVALDITDRKEAEMALSEAKARAEAANQAKTTFLSSMSHDIRTPLTSILGLSEILAEKLEEEDSEIAQNIHESCGQLMGTLESVLQLARLEGGKQELELQSMPVVEEIESQWKSLQRMEVSQTLQKSLELDDDDRLHAMIDKDALRRVLSNLVSNAFKHAGPDAVTTIRCRRSSDGSPVVVIEDTGQGIEPEFLEKLFQPFQQPSGGLDEAYAGSGLGLSICKQLMQMMGGSIWVESKVGEGTAFFLKFQAAVKGTPAPAKAFALRPGRKLNILVCDDHLPTADLVRRMLPEHSVISLTDPGDLRTFSREQDVVLMDIDFDGKDIGLELLADLRCAPDHGDTRVIAFTAHGLPGQREQFLELGFDSYLSKPFTKKQLLEALYHALSSGR